MFYKVSLLIILVSVTMLASVRQSTRTSTSTQQEELRETFERSYPLAPGGHVSLDNYTGTVQVTTWDRPEVKVSAVKRAYSPERMAEVKIEVTPDASGLSIVSRYARQNLRWSDSERERFDNSARVDYTLTVPRAARLDKFELHNGEISLDGLAGDVVVSTLNGGVKAHLLTGDVKVSTLNGRIEAEFGEMGEGQKVSLSSLNGQIVVSLASEDVRLSAGTMNGRMNNEFVQTSADAPGGGPRVDISNLNGDVTVRHAAPGTR